MKLIFTALFFLSFIALIQAQESKVNKNLEEALKTPEEVYQLDLSGQQLNSLPKNFKKLKNLKKLDLSDNKFTTLLNFGKFDNLEYLDLSNNNLSSIPAFIDIIGDNRNVMADNNPVTIIEAAKDGEVQITEQDYKGKISIGSSATQEFVKENNDDFLRIYPDTKRDIWLEIHLKKGKTNEELLKSVMSKKQEEFNYFINKHSTFDKPKDDLPPFVIYNYTNTSGKVGLSSNNFLVVFEKYFITLNTTEKYMTLYDVKRLLKSAITYTPVDDGVSFDILATNLKNVSSETFLVKAQKPEVNKINTELPELKTTKEIIYTMKPGETVAFTNEYQLGVELKEAEYYIYIKKGGKYYLHTAQKIFGPYDDLNSANPDNPNGDDLIKGFNVTKGNSKYVISEGKEIGPFSKESYYYSYKEVAYAIETKEKKYTVEVEGKKIGPFVSWPSVDKIEEGYVAYGKNENNKYDLYVNGVLAENNIERKGWGFTVDKQLVYDYMKDGKAYVKYQNESIGPFDEVNKIAVIEKLLSFSYKKEGKSYLYLNGKSIGPYDYIEIPYNIKATEAYLYKTNGEYFIQIVNGKLEGPFSSSPSIAYNSETNRYLIVAGSKGDKEVIYCGNKFGPFNDVYRAYGDFYNITFSKEKLPSLIVENKDQTYSIYVDEKMIGPFKGKPAYFYDSTSQNYAITYSTLNSNGQEEFNLILNEQVIGPFKSVKFNTNLAKETAAFYDFEFAVEDFNDKFYLIYPNKIFGPFDDCKFEYDYYPKNESVMYTIGNDSYFLYNEKGYGPIRKPKLTSEKDYPDLDFYQGQYFGKNYRNKEEPCIINNISFKESYTIIGQNNNNYVAETYSVKDRRFVLNNKLYTENILNFAWDDVNKIFYWLTIEGKNIIRNNVKF